MNWGRIITCAHSAFYRLFRLKVVAFVDDVYCAEPAPVVWSGFSHIKSFFSLIRRTASDKKDQDPDERIFLHGALLHFPLDVLWRLRIGTEHWITFV